MKVNIVSLLEVSSLDTLSASFYTSKVFEHIRKIDFSSMQEMAKAEVKSLPPYLKGYIVDILKQSYSNEDKIGIEHSRALSARTTENLIGFIESNGETKVPLLVSATAIGIIFVAKNNKEINQDAQKEMQQLLDRIVEIEDFLNGSSQQKKARTFAP